MNCGVGHRRGSDPALLWPWCRPAASAPIQPLAWGPPYAAGVVQEMANRQKKKKKSDGVSPYPLALKDCYSTWWGEQNSLRGTMILLIYI